MFEWDKLIDDCEKYYYTPLLMFIVEITALVIAIIYGRKSKIGRAFIFYIAFDFCFLIIGLILGNHSGISVKTYSRFLIYSNALIGLVELLVYYYFLIRILPYKKIKILMKILAAFYTVLIIIFLINGFNFITARLGFISYILGATEFIFLLPPCMLYFYSILKDNSEIPLFQRPSFWIVTGIFFFSLISIPFYLVNRYLLITNREFWFPLSAALYYIPFTLNFVFLIKAFLCKKPLTM